MSNIATKARKLGVFARVAAQQAGRHRGISSLIRAGRVTASQFGRVLGQLWLEVTGFVFLCLAPIGAGAFVREYSRYQAGQTTSGRVPLSVLFTVTFGWFGVSSFWRVKKKQ